MVWLHLKDEIKKKKPKKPLVLILGATHTVVYIRVCTQKKEEEEGFSMCVTQSFPSEYSTQKIENQVEKKVFTCDSPSVTRLDLSSVKESD
jgi:uncharacterized protein YneR